MGKAYILVILTCTILGFMYCCLAGPDADFRGLRDVHGNLFAIGLGAFFVGGLYAISGILVGWHFVRCLDRSKSRWAAFLIAAPVHFVSTLVAAYVIPSTVYLLTHVTDFWICEAFLSFFLGIPQALVDYFLLRWLFGFKLELKQIGVTWLWKTTTVMVYMFLLVTLPTMVLVGLR
ncbi:MAG: hypothetical protein K2X93_11705 [Candidatus Obscuribacterales bacterium]|nr:hypothetical protein [Candidatus Obscuribacterales bacterium]